MMESVESIITLVLRVRMDVPDEEHVARRVREVAEDLESVREAYLVTWTAEPDRVA